MNKYNGGEWTEARFRAFIKGGLRNISMKWGPRNACKKNARVRRGFYICAGCGEEVPSSLPPKKKGEKRIDNVFVDHIEPVIDPNVGFVDWNEVVSRMFVEEDGFQLLCKECHDRKTQGEKDIARKRKTNS